MISESLNHTGDFTVVGELRPVYDSQENSGEMENYPGVMSVLIEAFAKEGVRFDEADFSKEDFIHKDKYVTIIRGKANEFIDRALDRMKSGAARQ